jgi:hypothetical protein
MPSLQPSLALPLPQVSIAFGSIGGSYTAAGTFTSGIEILTLVSTLDKPVQVSFDGVNDHLVMPIGNTTPAAIQFNFKANLTAMGPTTIFVKTFGAGPGSGNLVGSAFSAVIQ